MTARRNILVLLALILYLAAHWPRPEPWPYLLPNAADHGIVEELQAPADVLSIDLSGLCWLIEAKSRRFVGEGEV